MTRLLARRAVVDTRNNQGDTALAVNEDTGDAEVARILLDHGADANARAVHTFSDEFVPDLVSALFVEAITWWLEHGRPYTPRDIATRAALLAAALFREASTW